MYPVIKKYIDLEHKRTEYKVGSTYPEKGFKTTVKRAKYLQEKGFLGDEIKPKKSVKKTDAE